MVGSHTATPSWDLFAVGLRNKEFHDNKHNWDTWLSQYGVPLWKRTITLVANLLAKSSMEVLTLRFEDLQADPASALRPVMEFLGTMTLHARGLETTHH
jgi:hypothetical protein